MYGYLDAGNVLDFTDYVEDVPDNKTIDDRWIDLTMNDLPIVNHTIANHTIT